MCWRKSGPSSCTLTFADELVQSAIDLSPPLGMPVKEGLELSTCDPLRIVGWVLNQEEAKLCSFLFCNDLSAQSSNNASVVFLKDNKSIIYLSLNGMYKFRLVHTGPSLSASVRAVRSSWFSLGSSLEICGTAMLCMMGIYVFDLCSLWGRKVGRWVKRLLNALHKCQLHCNPRWVFGKYSWV